MSVVIIQTKMKRSIATYSNMQTRIRLSVVWPKYQAFNTFSSTSSKGLTSIDYKYIADTILKIISKKLSLESCRLYQIQNTKLQKNSTMTKKTVNVKVYQKTKRLIKTHYRQKLGMDESTVLERAVTDVTGGLNL